MPKCPFCDEYFLSEGELNTHLQEKHPEELFSPKTLEKLTEDLWAKTELSVIYPAAARLTGISFGNKPTPHTEVLERFKFFLRELTLLIAKNE